MTHVQMQKNEKGTNSLSIITLPTQTNDKEDVESDRRCRTTNTKLLFVSPYFLKKAAAQKGTAADREKGKRRRPDNKGGERKERKRRYREGYTCA